MNGNVNPFRPWRPAGLEVPPPLHASRPWRPPQTKPSRAAAEDPPFAEAVDPPPRKSPRPRRKKTPRPAAVNPPPAELRPDQKVILGLFFALGLLALTGLAWLGGTHLPRVFTVLAAIAAGFTTGISLARRRTWTVRLGWMAAGLALAGLAGWFVPTLQGINLWSAYRQVDALRALPAGDVAGFAQGVPARKELIAEFPTFAEDLAAAERAWMRRTADDAIEKAERQLETDPQQALGDLTRMNTALASLEPYPLVRAEMEAAQQRTRQASLREVHR